MPRFDILKNSQVETLESVPASFRTLYHEDSENGGYRLTDNPETLTVLGALDDSLNTIEKLHKKQSPYDKLKDRGTPEEILAELDKVNQPAEPTKSNTAEAAPENDSKVSRQWHKTQVAKVESELMALKNKEVEETRKTLTEQLEDEINKSKKQYFESVFKENGAFKNSLDYLSSKFMGNFQRGEDEMGATKYYMVDGAGIKDVMMTDDGTKFKDLEAFALEIKSNPDYAQFFISETKSGTNTPTNNAHSGRYRTKEERDAYRLNVHPDQVFKR